MTVTILFKNNHFSHRAVPGWSKVHRYYSRLFVDLKDYIYKGIYETEVAFAKPKQTADLEVSKELFSSVTKITIIQALFSPG